MKHATVAVKMAIKTASTTLADFGLTNLNEKNLFRKHLMEKNRIIQSQVNLP